MRQTTKKLYDIENRFFGDTVFVKWGLPSGSSRTKHISESIACGIQLLTELAEFTIDPSQTMSSMTTEPSAIENSTLEFAGVGSLPNSSNNASALISENGPLPVTNLRMRIAVTAGMISNVVYGTKERMEYIVGGQIFDELCNLIGNTGIALKPILELYHKI